MSFGGLFKTGNQLFKALNADMGTRFQGSTQEDSESDDEVDPNFLAHGKRGVVVYKDIATKKIIHLDHEARAIRFYRNGVQKRRSYRLSGIISIIRTAENVVVFETRRTKALNAKVITLQTEQETTEFLGAVMYLINYGDILLSSYYYMVENKRGLMTDSGLHSALQLYDMNSGLTNRDLQQILDMSDVPDQFDFFDYFKNLLGTPVSNHRDCLHTLLKKSLAKIHPSLAYGDNAQCLDEYEPFTLDTKLIDGESVVDTAFFCRWLVSNCADRDIFSPGCTEMLDSASNFTHSGSVGRCVHASSKPGFIGHVLLTDYRIMFLNIHTASTRENAHFTRYDTSSFFDKMSIPLASIASVVLKAEPTTLLQKIYLKIKTKDHRKLRLIFLKSGTTYDMVKLFYQKIVSLCFASRNVERSMFAFKYNKIFMKYPTWSWSDILRDYTRLGFVNDPEWKIVENSGHITEQLCESYPSYLVLPAMLKKEDLLNCIAFRSKHRLPVVTYVHRATRACLTRSAQTLSTSGSKNLQSDVNLLNMYRTSGWFNELRESEFRPATYYIFDARSMLAAMANMAAGRGTEEVDNYIHTEIVFCGIDNIHVMRASYEALCKAVLMDAKCCLSEMDSIHQTSIQKNTSTISHREEQFDFMKRVDASNWITHCSKVLMASVLVAEKLHLEGCSCLVHCSDGWDRTAQMTAIAQLLLDPYYRSFEGFAVLIEKEFCAFGHKFDDRCGHLRLSSAKDAEERSPIFIQFLDVVHNILLQFPFSFEFNEELLVFLADHVYSCLFGNFLGNCEVDRVDKYNVRQKTQSLWSYVLSQQKHFFNDKYRSGVDEAAVIWPAFNPRSLQLWRRFFLRWTVNAHMPATPWHDDWGNERETLKKECKSPTDKVSDSSDKVERPGVPRLTRVHSAKSVNKPGTGSPMRSSTKTTKAISSPTSRSTIRSDGDVVEGSSTDEINISLGDVSSDSDDDTTTDGKVEDKGKDKDTDVTPEIKCVDWDDDETCSV
mmetsp:Transcript_1686/g.3145  ORF Transcript_1686/g.3145 Transcript_1686/m.3145 type:complete len:1001 (-) Transcript_1686:1399-4401(-)